MFAAAAVALALMGAADDAGYATAAKLGVPDNPLRHTAADRAGRLQETTFPRMRKLLEALLQTG